jgi:hypothetical protein
MPCDAMADAKTAVRAAIADMIADSIPFSVQPYRTDTAVNRYAVNTVDNTPTTVSVLSRGVFEITYMYTRMGMRCAIGYRTDFNGCAGLAVALL